MIERESLKRIAEESQEEEVKELARLDRDPSLAKWRMIEVTLWMTVIVLLVFWFSGMNFLVAGIFLEILFWLALLSSASYASYKRWTVSNGSK